jgi:DNA-directed RNA polymerase subunit N
MMVPVRCFTCGKVVAAEYEEFVERAEQGDEDAEEVLDDLGVERYCCRRIIVSHQDLVDTVAPYQ